MTSPFRTPQVVLFCAEPDRAAAFYARLGFTQVFRTPASGPPIHVDVELDGYRIGLASLTSTRIDHGLDPVATGQRAAVVVWTDDVAAVYAELTGRGVPGLAAPGPWLQGRLTIAWVADPDGHPECLGHPDRRRHLARPGLGRRPADQRPRRVAAEAGG